MANSTKSSSVSLLYTQIRQTSYMSGALNVIFKHDYICVQIK